MRWGRALAGRCAEVAHDVVVATRDPARNRERDDDAGWLAAHDAVRLVANAEAGAQAELLVNATNGAGSLAATTDAGVAPEHRVLDLGGLSAARATEMYLPLWLSILTAAGTADVNIAVCR